MYMYVSFNFCYSIYCLRRNKLYVPPIMRKRGRPKGCDTTVIGLPRKKSKTRRNYILPFVKLPMNMSLKEKRKLLLNKCRSISIATLVRI